MDIRSVHYDFKKKLNKIDSQQNKNLRVPEIDWVLNEAYEIYVKSIAEPRVYNHLGFEVNQRTIDDLRTIVVNNQSIFPQSGELLPEYTAQLPDNYWFLLSAYVVITKPNCGTKRVRATLIQHDDKNESNNFYSPSFEWEHVNIRFYDGGIKVFTDETFTVNSIELNYIRKIAYVHNAQDFLPSGTYNLPDGTVLTGSQDFELPEHTHREIVDIAVLITSGELSLPDYQIKQAKLNLNQIN